MIISFSPITYDDETLYAYAFRKEGENFEILNNSLMSYEAMPENLLNCLVTQYNQVILASCSAIDNPLKAKQFLSLLKFWQSNAFPSVPLRICIVHLSVPVVEWEAIEKEHHLLAAIRSAYKGDLIYLNLPLDPISGTAPPAGPDAQSFKHLSQIQNMEAWSYYCLLLNEEMERVLRTFLPSMIDEYQLEARFKDFRHEVKSPLLQDAKKELIESALKVNEVGGNPEKIEEFKEAEKKLLKNQEYLFQCMKQHEKAIAAVEIGIGKIEKAHPELLSFKQKVTLLRTLLRQQLMQESLPADFFLHQLLNMWFQVTTVMSGDDGLGRISWEFAARQALIQTASRYSAPDLLDLFFNWKARHEELNRFCKEKGAEGFHFWLHVPPADEEDAKRRSRLLPLFTLQTKFIEHLEHFILPLAKLNTKGKTKVKADSPEMAALTPFIRGLEQWKTPEQLTDRAVAFYSSIF